MTPDRFIAAAFSGSDADLIRSAKALLALDEAGSIVPHGIGGHARTIITAFIDRFGHRAAELARESVGDGELLPCICGAPVDQDECPYPTGKRASLDGRAMYVVNCTNGNCGWQCLGWGKDGARTAWNTRAAGDDARDARRYRWLRISAYVSWNGYVTYSNLMATDVEREEMDAAIDSAIVRSAE